jgi:hypothetical protein
MVDNCGVKMGGEFESGEGAVIKTVVTYIILYLGNNAC